MGMLLKTNTERSLTMSWNWCLQKRLRLCGYALFDDSKQELTSIFNDQHDIKKRAMESNKCDDTKQTVFLQTIDAMSPTNVQPVWLPEKLVLALAGFELCSPGSTVYFAPFRAMNYKKDVISCMELYVHCELSFNRGIFKAFLNVFTIGCWCNGQC